MIQEIKILISGISKLDVGNSYTLHSHPYYQLNHIIKGKYSYIVDDCSFLATVGDTIFIPANSMHSFKDIGKETGYYFEINFIISQISRNYALTLI